MLVYQRAVNNVVDPIINLPYHSGMVEKSHLFKHGDGTVMVDMSLDLPSGKLT
jgi:hypothetical protein